MFPTLATSPSVREIETADGTVILDIAQGLCFSLTTLGGLIWNDLKLGRTPQQIIEHLASEFPHISSQQICDDFGSFYAKLQNKRLILDAHEVNEHVVASRLLTRLVPTPTLSRKPFRTDRGRFSVWCTAFVGLLLFDLFQLGSDFNRLYECVRTWPLAKRCSLQASEPAWQEVCQAVNEACTWYPKRILCLQRSVVTTWLLRNCGIPAQTVIGAQKLPFKAHAWVEVNGVPINERRDVKATYLIWDRC